VLMGSIIAFINRYPETYQQQKNNGLQLLWISPLRALAKDIGRAMEEVIAELGLEWKVAVRNGDTSTAERQRQKKNLPEILIITPESLHLLLAQKQHEKWFTELRTIAVDEWHELMGSKRGVQVELALSRIWGARQSAKETSHTPLSIWGISATIGNMEEAQEVLLSVKGGKGTMVRTNMHKRISVQSIFPDAVEKYPWAGHLGIKLIDKIIPLIEQSRSTLIFINTRGMAERWYQELLMHAPELAGAVALHHGSIEQALRIWVEDALHAGKLKTVVCTASLDLGVDFRPVETVIQVGSPKGISRFLQRAGRSGHQPDAESKIYFLPTHSLELTEAAALKKAMEDGIMESKAPPLLCYDVLLQYLSTLAVADGFVPENIVKEIRSTYCFREMDDEAWHQILSFLTTGGKALQAYYDYNKVEIHDGIYKIMSRRIAMRHRMHIGTIVSDAMLKVKWMGGGYIGMIEEWFISKLEPGDVFTLAGRNLELITIRDMTVIVKASKSTKSIVPSWQGGRMPLSANLGATLREQLSLQSGLEMEMLQPLLEQQRKVSAVPKKDELLIEHIETKDGFHLFVYPFEGRLVHEAMAAVLAWRISRIQPMTFTFAMNDYGFELLSDQPIPVDDTNVYDLFSA
ncbi:MAG: DEAD/DEAH box helicase, partial [Chitinophagaceae bacterium]